MEESDHCILCKQPLEGGKLAVVTLREKGSAGINRASEEHNDSVRTVPGKQVHQECRRSYCNPHKIAQANKQTTEKPGPSTFHSVLCSAEESFSFSTDCLFCGTPVKLEEQKKRCLDIFPVTTLSTKDTILATCQERGDNWANSVRARILHVHDLPAADALYHHTCSINFRTGKQVPKMYVTEQIVRKKTKVGRPQDEEKTEVFLKIAKYLEDNNDEQITITDLIDKMDELLVDSDSAAYGHTHMKAKLKEHFGDQIIITEINGKVNVVTFRGTADAVLQDFHARQKDDPEREKMHIIQAAAKLIRDDIKSVKTSNESYPASHEIESEEECLKFLPETLKLLLEGIFRREDVGVPLASIGQAIMQTTRPRVLLAPLQVGLGVQLHHHFASRFLIDSLHHHGFCCSYKEAERFDQMQPWIKELIYPASLQSLSNMQQTMLIITSEPWMAMIHSMAWV